MDDFDRATERADLHRAVAPTAVAARYEPGRDRVVIELSTGDTFAFSPRGAQGLEHARASDLDAIEISPSGRGLHFPKLDADLWVPALLGGTFGSRRWMAARLGAQGGKAKTRAKAKAARANGKLGGRPRKAKAGSRPRKSKRPLHRRSRRA